MIRRVRPLRALLAALLVPAGGCCDLPNARHPVSDPPDPRTTLVVYGDSFVHRHGGQGGYGVILRDRLARREVVADEGNPGREAAIGAIADPVNDRCRALTCNVFYDCLSKGNAPLVSVLREHPEARKLLLTLGGVELLGSLRLAYGEPWQVPDPASIPDELENAAIRIAINVRDTLDLARADRDWDWIGITSYPYMPTDSRDPVVPCPLEGIPLGPADQAVMNELARALDRILAGVAADRDVAFVSLLDVLGGGVAIPGGETGPPGAHFDDCGHPTQAGYARVVDRIAAAIP